VQVSSIIPDRPVAFYCYGKWEMVDESLFEVFPYHMQVDITPEFAKDVLANLNPVNRHIDEKKAVMYARMMRQGDWKVINEIVFHRDGRLPMPTITSKAIRERSSTLRIPGISRSDERGTEICETRA